MTIKLVFSILVLFIALSGCASMEADFADVKIERVHSASAQIENIIVTKTDTVVTITGTLQSRTRSYPIGFAEITFISPDNEKLHSLKSDYRQRDSGSREYHFYLEVPLHVPDGSTVRVTHVRN